jgi:cell division protein FtsZ
MSTPDRTNLNFTFDDDPSDYGARIKVIGIGGSGGNAVNHMIDAGIVGVEFLVANTDLQALKRSKAQNRLQLGAKLTKGLGAGANPRVGREAALEDTDKIIEALEGADMVFVTVGLGGGTGTGAAPIIASLATELEALTVAIVTKPFPFEGRHRMRQAEAGLEELRSVVDTLITIPNEKLLQAVERNAPLGNAFLMADDVLLQAVQGISDLITTPGFINVDFADVRAIMKGMGVALMGTGQASGEHRAIEATQRAISSPLLEEATMNGARGVLVNISGGLDLTLAEVDEAMSVIHNAADPEANIIFGTVPVESMANSMKITVIATGFENDRRQVQPDRTAWNGPATHQSKVNDPVGSASTGIRISDETVDLLEDLDIPTFIRKRAD